MSARIASVAAQFAAMISAKEVPLHKPGSRWYVNVQSGKLRIAYAKEGTSRRDTPAQAEFLSTLDSPIPWDDRDELMSLAKEVNAQFAQVDGDMKTFLTRLNKLAEHFGFGQFEGVVQKTATGSQGFGIGFGAIGL